MALNQNAPTADATTITKGKVQLAGDLGGTAASPTVVNQHIPYKFRAYRNGAQNCGNATLAIVNFDTENYDTGNNFDVTTNVGRFTAPVAGFYQFDSWITYVTGGAGSFRIALYKNGSIVTSGFQYFTAGNVTTTIGVNDVLQLSATDYVEVYLQGLGGAITTGTANNYFAGRIVSL